MTLEMSTATRTCQSCGMLLDDAGEFHPYGFCVLKKARRDPWAEFCTMVKHVYGFTPPSKPPLIRNLPLEAPKPERKDG